MKSKLFMENNSGHCFSVYSLSLFFFLLIARETNKYVCDYI